MFRSNRQNTSVFVFESRAKVRVLMFLSTLASFGCSAQDPTSTPSAVQPVPAPVVVKAQTSVKLGIPIEGGVPLEMVAPARPQLELARVLSRTSVVVEG